MRFLLIGLIVLAGCVKETPPDQFDEFCESCRTEGQSCRFSTNCAPGSICNEPANELFDDSKIAMSCTRVLCSNSADCDRPKECTLEGVCRLPTCQLDADCANGGLACVGGECTTPPPLEPAQRCAIMTLDRSLRTGMRMELTAIALKFDGHVIPLAQFTWSSSDPEIVRIQGSTAIAGARAGRAELSARIAGVACSGLTLTNFTEIEASTIRVVAADERTGKPLTGALVTVIAGQTQTQTQTLTATTAADGSVTWPNTTAPIESVTVTKRGYKSISVIEPGSNDVFVASAPLEDFTRAGGIRGRVGLGTTRSADIKAGLVYGARSIELLDYKAVPGADLVPTTIDAPELGINMSTSDMPGNVMLGMGNKHFTKDDVRCRGDELGENQMGCFLARTREGRTAAWVMGGQLKLSQITAFSGVEFAVEDDGMFTAKDRARLIAIMSPLTRSLNFGALPYLEIEPHNKVPRDRNSGANCADPAVAVTTACTADFDFYQKVDVELVERPAILSTIIAPELPELPVERRCAGTMMISEYAVLPGRGLVLLGLATSKDARENEAADCVVAGDRDAFGFDSKPLDDGEVAFMAAPLHSGLEGSARIMTIAALDIGDGETRPRDLNLLVEKIDRLETSRDLTERKFLPYPGGIIRRASSVFSAAGREVDPAVTGRRITIESAAGVWIVYAPPSKVAFDLPDVAEARAVLADSRSGLLQETASDANFASWWDLGSGARSDRSIEHLRAIATTQCGRTGPCTID